MPEKSVREMNAIERKHYSLESRVFHSVLFGSIIIGLVTLLVGLGMYAYSLVKQYISEAYSFSYTAGLVLDQVTDARGLAQDVMEAYRGLSDEERAQTGTDAYRDRFAYLTEREDYQTIRTVLSDFEEAGNLFAVYLAAYDADTGAMVYVADPDPDPETQLLPVDWEPVSKGGLEKFMNYDGTTKPYDIDHTDKYGWLCTSGAPLLDSDGHIVAYVLADISLDNIIDGMKNFVMQYSIVLLIVMILFGVLLTQRMKKTVVKPINAIAEAAREYAEDKRAGVTDTEHFAMLNIRTGDEIENLSLIMADMEQDLTSYVDDLTKVTAEKERVSTELNMANQIQESMLPNIYPAFPDRPEFDIYATMEPAREVGGDFYDFFLVDDDHLCMVMADVSGKGVPAALFMMASKIILANNAKMGKSPAEVLTATNASICSNNRMEMFVTVWLGILEISTGKLTAANAGHEYPVIKKADGRFELIKDKHGFVIGGMDGIRYKEYELQLEPGSKLFLYTDGVPEATDASGGMFGPGRMVEALNQQPDAAPDQILKNVRKAVDGFVQDAEQFDDLTMLCMEYQGDAPAQAEDVGGKERECRIMAAVENLPQVLDFIEQGLADTDCTPRAQMQINIAAEEIFVNIAHYAYAPNQGMATVLMQLSEDRDVATITFIDHGVPYDPLAKEDPDITLSAEERGIGGLGIYMTKKSMDEVTYRYEEGQNILTMKKRLR